VSAQIEIRKTALNVTSLPRRRLCEGGNNP
jgi:hypothetical protein